MIEVEEFAFWLLAGFMVFAAAVVAAAIMVQPAHAHEHCIRQDYISEGKAGYQWECVKWAKL